MKMSQIVKKIEFYGDEIIGAKIGEDVYTPAKPICERLSLAWGPQHRKLTSDPIYAEGVTLWVIPEIDTQPMLFIKADLIPFWLVRVSAKRIDPSKREKLICYQKEAARVLAQAFMGAKQQKPLTNAQLIAQMANEIAEQEQRQALLENKIFQVEQEVNAIKTHNDADYMCVKGYARNHGHKVDRALAQKIGIKCGKLFRQRLGLEPPKIEDELFGTVNLYTQDILTEVFNEHFQSKGEVA